MAQQITSMAKKLKLDFDYFEDYNLLSIATQMKDYTLAFHINRTLEISLKKYDDLVISGRDADYPWFYYSEGSNYPSYYLIGNNHPNGKINPSQKGIDYYLLIKELFDNNMLNRYASDLRKVYGILGVFNTDMSAIKNMDVMIECVELHELDYIIRPSKKLISK